MVSLIIGGSGSGKSAFAESLVQSLGGNRIYIATMEPTDGECLRRIARHRDMRAEKGFSTVERYTDLAGLSLPEDANVLLEDLSNLLANEMFSPVGGGSESAEAGLDALLRQSRDVTVVTNEVFSGGAVYEGETLRFLRCLAAINRRLAARADLVVETVCGLPQVLKGTLQ